MIKRTFIQSDILTKDTPTNIAWCNLQTADKYSDLISFNSSAVGWLKANLDKNYQDLEKELRQRNFDTHLIATPNPNIPNTIIKLPNSDIEKKYLCTTSCRSRDDAVKELLQYSSSYEENFDKLKNAGILNWIKKSTDPITVGSHILEPIDINNNTLLTNNGIILKLEKLTPENFIESLKFDLSSIHKNVKESILALGVDGNLVYVLTNENNAIISKYGFTVINNKTVMSIITLRDPPDFNGKCCDNNYY